MHSDDQRTIAVRATDDLRILLVDGEPGAAEAENPTFYLRHALTPVPTSELDTYAIKTKKITPEELDSIKLNDFEAVVLANVPTISNPSLDAIAAYLKRGGGLIVFPGTKVNASFYNDNLAKKFDFLPATLGAIRGEPDQTEKFLTFQGDKYKHPIVLLWNDPGMGTLNSAHFYRSFELKPVEGHSAHAGEAQVVLNFSDGSPAMMERTWGRGRVVLFGSTANTAWNDLALRTAYLPLIDRTLGFILNRQDARINIPVGSLFEWVCDPDWVNKEAVIVVSGDKKGVSLLRRIGMEEGLPLLRVEETEKAGGYEVQIKSDPPQILKFAVQSNPAESNLEELGPVQLESLAAIAQVIHWTPQKNLAGQLNQPLEKMESKGATELWMILVILVLITTVIEMGLAAKFSATK